MIVVIMPVMDRSLRSGECAYNLIKALAFEMNGTRIPCRGALDKRQTWDLRIPGEGRGGMVLGTRSAVYR